MQTTSLLARFFNPPLVKLETDPLGHVVNCFFFHFCTLTFIPKRPPPVPLKTPDFYRFCLRKVNSGCVFRLWLFKRKKKYSYNEKATNRQAAVTGLLSLTTEPTLRYIFRPYCRYGWGKKMEQSRFNRGRSTCQKATPVVSATRAFDSVRLFELFLFSIRYTVASSISFCHSIRFDLTRGARFKRIFVRR